TRPGARHPSMPGAGSTGACATFTPPPPTSGSLPTPTSSPRACSWGSIPARPRSEEARVMDALELINLRYDAVHGGFVDDLFSGLSDEQVRQRPGGVNSIVWLVWHLARVQDAAVSRFVDDRPQVLEEGRWNEAMRLDRRDVGSGMTSQEADALSAAIEITALRGYHRAVAERTKVIATSLSPGAWNELVPAERIHQMVAKEG